jgi:ketosteroid isomerase-like protein
MEVAREIVALEENLVNAMLYSDVAVMDRLLHSELLFVNHLGMLIAKSDDLAQHLSGDLKYSKISITDQQITVLGDTALVSVFTEMNGSYQSQEFEIRVRFIRVWKRFDAGWMVIAASSVPV